MNARGAYHVVNECQAICDGPEFSHWLGKKLATVAVWLEFPYWFEPGAKAILKGLDRLSKVTRLTVVLYEVRLIVKKINMTCSACHE
jgi:hypothetical protein